MTRSKRVADLVGSREGRTASPDVPPTKTSNIVDPGQRERSVELLGQQRQRPVHSALSARCKAIKIRTPDGAGGDTERERLDDIGAAEGPAGPPAGGNGSTSRGSGATLS